VFLWSVPILLVGFAVSWFLREAPLRDTVHVGTDESSSVARVEDNIALGIDPDLDPGDLPAPLSPR
jgi:hypothetical protein